MKDSTVMRTMLFDFYGDLLTEKQREYFDLHYNEDLSLQEIAEQNGVSRQAVWDIIRRAEQAMLDIEEKIGLISRMERQREKLHELSGLLSKLSSKAGGEEKALFLRASELLESLES